VGDLVEMFAGWNLPLQRLSQSIGFDADSMVDESMSFRTFEQDKIAQGLLSPKNE
jgi:hypothetical protein